MCFRIFFIYVVIDDNGLFWVGLVDCRFWFCYNVKGVGCFYWIIICRFVICGIYDSKIKVNKKLMLYVFIIDKYRVV